MKEGVASRRSVAKADDGVIVIFIFYGNFVLQNCSAQLPPRLRRYSFFHKEGDARCFAPLLTGTVRCFCLFPKKALLFSAGIEFGAVLGQTKNRYEYIRRSGRGVHKSNTTMILWHYYSQTPRRIMRRV